MDLIKLRQIAQSAAIVPYCGDKEGLEKYMKCKLQIFQSTFTPEVVLSLLDKLKDDNEDPTISH